MPLKRCQKEGNPGWKWGDAGKCYTYNPKVLGSEAVAKSKAKKQAAAIIISRGKP